MAAILTTGIWGQIGLELIFQQYYQGVNSFALLAVPLFMLQGTDDQAGPGMTLSLLAKLLVGRMRGRWRRSTLWPRCFCHNVRPAVADTAAIGGVLPA